MGTVFSGAAAAIRFVVTPALIILTAPFLLIIQLISGSDALTKLITNVVRGKRMDS